MTMPILTVPDIAAVLWFLVAWFSFSYLIDMSPWSDKSLSKSMVTYRRMWMLTMASRRVRIMDTNIMSGLQQGTAFFASTAMLAIGGCFALLDSTDTIQKVANELAIPIEASRALWDVKVLGLMLILAYAFFKFGWAYRIFNYSSIIMGAVPEPGGAATNEDMRTIALQAADLNVLAGNHFNRGQRAFFFAIAFLGWFAGPYFFAFMTLAVLLVLLRRQFGSRSRAIALSGQKLAESLAAKEGEYTDTGSSNPLT